MSRPKFYDKFPTLWALRRIVKWVPMLGDPERRWLIDRLSAEIGRPSEPLPKIVPQLGPPPREDGR